jgi:hypothetical protein
MDKYWGAFYDGDISLFELPRRPWLSHPMAAPWRLGWRPVRSNSSELILGNNTHQPGDGIDLVQPDVIGQLGLKIK